jgi:hypothetical protein
MPDVPFRDTCDLTFNTGPDSHDTDIRATLTIDQAVRYAANYVLAEARQSCTIFLHDGRPPLRWPEIETGRMLGSWKFQGEVVLKAPNPFRLGSSPYGR